MKSRILFLIMALLTALLVFLGYIALSFPEENPYTAQDFVYENGYLTCKTAKSALGIDVSRYQGEIDWRQVRDAGVEFVFIRLGYRSSKDGQLYEDLHAKENLQGALDAGLKVGGYLFSQAMSEQEAREEAEFAISIVKDYEINLPLVFDWETVDTNVKTRTMHKELMTKCIHSFCKAVEKAGYESMVYFNRDFSRKYVDVWELRNYQIWFAMYEAYPDAPFKPDYWQYTNKGTVPGIEGNVDLNLWFYEE